MGICASTNSKHKYADPHSSKDMKNVATIKRSNTNTFKRGATFYGTRGVGNEREQLNLPSEVEGGSQRVETFLTLRNIPNNNYTFKIKVSICNDKMKNVYTSLGETEAVLPDDNNSIVFSISFIYEYFFEKEQILKFVIIANDLDTYASCEEVVGKIMGSRGSYLAINLPVLTIPHAELILEVDCKNASQSAIETKLALTANFHKKCTDVFYVLNNFNDNKNWRKVYKSREYSGTKIAFDTLKILLDILCGGNVEKPVKFEFYEKDGEFIGESIVQVSSLKNNINEYAINDSKGNTIGELTVSYTEDKVMKFIDYLKAGMQINFIVGIDFTCSNIDPHRPESLHYCQGNVPNPYERATRACGSIVAYYDYDQLFPVYGFGGRLPNDIKVNHCFHLNLQQDPNVQGLEGIVTTYKDALLLIKLDGPTFFAPLIRTVLNNIKASMNQSVQIYYILMILTDGLINDMDATIDVLVECDVYPLSVIIIGIGNADFSNMNVLDGDDEPLVSTKGVKTRRDLVQFVEFNKFKDVDANKLAEEVLQEVPRQVEEYYQLTNAFKNINI